MKRTVKELPDDMKIALAMYNNPVTVCDETNKRFKTKLPDRMRPIRY